MVSETATKVFDIAEAREKVSSLNSQYDAIMVKLVEAGKVSDVATMTSLGAQMSTISVERDKLIKRIDRAERGEGSVGLETRIKTRDNALTGLVNFLHEGNDVANLIREMLVSSPGIKQIRIDVDASTVTSASVVGGFRTVKATGIKRPRAKWSTDGGTTTSSSKDVVIQYGQKYGQTKPYADMTPAERNALLNKIVDGENMVNVAKAETPTE